MREHARAFTVSDLAKLSASEIAELNQAMVDTILIGLQRRLARLRQRDGQSDEELDVSSAPDGRPR